MRNALLKYYPFLPLLLLCGFYIYKAIIFPVHDFSNYYFGGKFLSEGHFNSDIYFPYEFNKAISDSGYTDIFASYAPNTPFLALFFSAFSTFSLAASKLIFNIISVALFVFSIFRIFKHYKIEAKYAILIPVLFLVPIKNNLLFGQVYFLLFFLLAEGLLAYEKKYWKSMAIYWSLAILLKVFPLVIVAFLLFRKQWKPLSLLMISSFMLFGISLLFTGFNIWIFYLKEVLPKASNGEIATGFVDNYQSVFMFLKRLFIYQNTENPYPFFHADSWFFALVYTFKIGILVVGYFVSTKITNSIFAFSYWILAMILLSPYGSTYTFVLLIFPFLTLLKSEVSNIKKIIFCSLLLLINNLPLSFFIENEFPFSYLRLFLLILVFVLFLIQLKQMNWKTFSVFCLTPMILLLIHKKEDIQKSTIFFNEGPMLIYDYTIQSTSETGLHLSADFWDGKKKMIIWATEIQKSEPLKLKDNQVFYNNRQLTFDKSNKLKPMLIDDKFILYLSDYDRGIGFYMLRKIELGQ